MKKNQKNKYLKHIALLIALIITLVFMVGVAFWYLIEHFPAMPYYATYEALNPKYGNLKQHIDQAINSENSLIAVEKKLSLVKLPSEALLFTIKVDDDKGITDKEVVIYASKDWEVKKMLARGHYGYGTLRIKFKEVEKDAVLISDSITVNKDLEVDYRLYLEFNKP